jgi:hypothetical protein
MKLNKTDIVQHYVTSDNMIFENKTDAVDHEYELTREKLYNNSLIIGNYRIYLISDKDELGALANDWYCERTFDLPDDYSLPMFICESNCEDYYYYYETLDSVIEKEEQRLNELKKINFKEL